MRNLPCALWLVLAPVASRLSDYLDFLAAGNVPQHYSADVRGAAAIIELVVWVVVGSLLYEPRRGGGREDVGGDHG